MRGRGGGWGCIGCWGHQVCVFDRGEVGGGGEGEGGVNDIQSNNVSFLFLSQG